MRHPLRALLALMAMFTVLGTTGAAEASTWDVPTASSGQPAASLDEFEDQLMVAVNEARAANGRKRIRVYDTCVDNLAEQWGAHLAATGRFEHRDQNEVLRQCGVSWAGENLVRGSGLTPEIMVQAWLDSPGHRVILLNRKARRSGVSVTTDAEGRYVGVLNVVRAG